MENTDKMLESLFPGVDPPIRTERKGNPLEQGLAVGRDGLTRDEVLTLVGKSGVLEKYNLLPDNVKELTDQCLFSLWKLDRIGHGIENKDRMVIGGTELRSLIEKKSEEIKENFHRNNEWLPHSVNSLIQYTSEKDKTKRREFLDGVFLPPDSYIRKLRIVGYDYSGGLNTIRDLTTREKVNSYLDGERGGDLQVMTGTLSFGRLSSAVHEINSTFETSK